MLIDEEKLKELSIVRYPEEACAIILTSGEIIELPNVATYPRDSFAFDPITFMTLCLKYPATTFALWHSHTKATPGLDIRTPSAEDVELYDRTGCFLYISGYDGQTYSPCIRFPAPPNQLATLFNRPYIAGVNDCGTLVRDAYLGLFGVELDYVFKAAYLNPANWAKAVLEFLERNHFYQLSTEEPLQRGDILVVNMHHLKDAHGVMVWDDNLLLLNQSKTSQLCSMEDVGPITSRWRLLCN